jgi:hypothetical protein
MKWKLLAVAGAAVFPIAVMAGPAQASTPASTPVGTWSGTVTRPGETDNIQLAFTKSGKACLFTVDGRSLGVWFPTSGSTFDYKILEAAIDPTSGQQTGWVLINQDAQENGSAFTSSGVSDIFDLNFNPTGTANATVSVTRVSAQPENC